jgi:hypothetical protein
VCETYNFLTRNARVGNLGEFFHSVGQSKRKVTSLVQFQDNKENNNLASLVRSDKPNSTGLQLVHSLFMGRDTSDESKLIGFLGYSNFEQPVEVSTKQTTSIMTGIRNLTSKSESGSLPTGADLLKAQTDVSVENFVAAFDLDSLSNEALAEAKKIPSALLLNSFALQLIEMEENSTASNLLGQLGATTPYLKEHNVKKIDGLVRFLWAIAKGCNPITPTFKVGDWDTDTMICIGVLKAKFNQAEQQFLREKLNLEEELGSIEDKEEEPMGKDGVPLVGDDSDEEADDSTTPTSRKEAPGPSLGSTGNKKATMKGKPAPKFGSTARRLISAAALGSDSKDSEDTALSAKPRR